MRTPLAVASLLLLLSTPCWAVLGEPEETVASDREHLNGELRSTLAERFAVHEITTTDGTTVREYASPAGMVFAVSWQGPFVPDMARLLGSYFQEFQEAGRSRARARRPLAARTAHLVVEMGGHMRAFQGRVYLPGALPEGVTESDVR